MNLIKRGKVISIEKSINAINLYPKPKDGYGPLISGKKETYLYFQGFYDFDTGEVRDENDEIIDKENIGKIPIGHYKRIKGKLTVYVRSYGSKKAYDSKAEFEMLVGCL